MNNCVLFVDDEPHVTEGLKRALRHEPYRMLTADSAAAGLVLLAAENIDIVISDEQMPGVSGCEFLAEVRRKYPSTIRMMLTGQASMEAAIRAINDGEVYRFFTKPCSPAEIKIALRQAVMQKELVSQSRKLLEKYREKTQFLDDLQRSSPDLLRVDVDDGGAILVSDSDDDIDALLNEINSMLGKSA